MRKNLFCVTALLLCCFCLRAELRQCKYCGNMRELNYNYAYCSMRCQKEGDKIVIEKQEKSLQFWKKVAENQKKAQKRQREKAQKKINADLKRMDQIIGTSVLWNAHSKTSGKKYFYQLVRANGGDLIAYVGENYKKMAIQKYWFKAEAMDEFAPTIPKGSSGYLRINISDNQGNGYILTDVQMTYNNAKTMTIYLEELPGNKVKCQIWTGHWHKRGEAVKTIFNRILSATGQKGKAYTYSLKK